MTPRSPSPVAVAELPDGVRYTLPRRPSAAFRRVGVVQFVVGLVLCGAPLYPVAMVVQAVCGRLPPESGLWWLGGVILTVSVAVGGAHVVAVGLFIAAGHSEVELRGSVLRAIERCGPLCWVWERSVRGLRRLFVSEGVEPLHRYGALPPTGARLCVITPDWQPVVGGPPVQSVRLAPGYPRDWLAPLADDLARRCLGSSPDAPATATPTAPPVVAAAPSVSETEELDQQPVGSAVRMDASDDRLVLRIPPLPTTVYFVGAAVFAGLLLAVLSGGIETEGVWDKLLLSGLFSAAGVGFGAVGWSRRRQTTLAVVDGALIVDEVGGLGGRRQTWPREEVADVMVLFHADPSGEGDDWWELQILFGPVGEFRCLAHRDPAELRWVATTLRRTLGCQGRTGASPPVGQVVSTPFNRS